MPHPEPPVAISVRDHRMWVLAPNREDLVLFENDIYLSEIKIKSWYFDSKHTSNAFTFRDEKKQILLPAPPRTRGLALIYGYEGKHHKLMGKILPIKPNFLNKNPALNDTLWISDKTFFYCLWKYRPVIHKYNAELEEVTKFRLTGIKEPAEQKIATPLFFDFKAHRGFVFAIDSKGMLIQLDPKDGKILKTRRFIAPGHSTPIPFRVFSLLEDDKIVLAHPYLKWGHDLWVAEFNL